MFSVAKHHWADAGWGMKPCTSFPCLFLLVCPWQTEWNSCETNLHSRKVNFSRVKEEELKATCCFHNNSHFDLVQRCCQARGKAFWTRQNMFGRGCLKEIHKQSSQTHCSSDTCSGFCSCACTHTCVHRRACTLMSTHTRCWEISEAVNKSDKGLRSNLPLQYPGNLEAPQGHTHTRARRQVLAGRGLNMRHNKDC